MQRVEIKGSTQAKEAQVEAIKGLVNIASKRVAESGKISLTRTQKVVLKHPVNKRIYEITDVYPPLKDNAKNGSEVMPEQPIGLFISGIQYDVDNITPLSKFLDLRVLPRSTDNVTKENVSAQIANNTIFKLLPIKEVSQELTDSIKVEHSVFDDASKIIETKKKAEEDLKKAKTKEVKGMELE